MAASAPWVGAAAVGLGGCAALRLVDVVAGDLHGQLRRTARRIDFQYQPNEQNVSVDLEQLASQACAQLQTCRLSITSSLDAVTSRG